MRGTLEVVADWTYKLCEVLLNLLRTCKLCEVLLNLLRTYYKLCEVVIDLLRSSLIVLGNLYLCI